MNERCRSEILDAVGPRIGSSPAMPQALLDLPMLRPTRLHAALLLILRLFYLLSG